MGDPCCDRHAILDIVAEYAHAVDDRDIDRIVACFSRDGRIEFEGGQTSGEGHDGIRTAYEQAFAQPVFALPATSTHLMSNTLMSIDADNAHAETEGVAFLASGPLGQVTTRGLRYSDDLRREAAGWRITRRIHRSIWQTTAPGEVH